MHDVTYQEIQERRVRKRDILSNMLKMFSALDVMILCAIIILIAYAQPDSFAHIDRHIGLRVSWDHQLLGYLFYVLVFGLIVGGVGLMVNSQRLKRQGDRVRINLIIVSLTSLLGILFYISY